MTHPALPSSIDPFPQEPNSAPQDPLDALAESMHLLELRLLTWIHRITGDATSETAVNPLPDPDHDLADLIHLENQ
jgi:hypothetical protein